MIVRRLATVAAVATLAGSGAYLFVYLYRWEWNRALTAGVIFLAMEVALAAMRILERLRRLELALARPRARRHRPIPQASPRDHFAWLHQSANRTSVFIPILMGAGILLSSLAWVFERVARMSSGTSWRDDGALTKLQVPDRPLVGPYGLPPGDQRAHLLAPFGGEP